MMQSLPGKLPSGVVMRPWPCLGRMRPPPGTVSRMAEVSIGTRFAGWVGGPLEGVIGLAGPWGAGDGIGRIAAGIEGDAIEIHDDTGWILDDDRHGTGE